MRDTRSKIVISVLSNFLCHTTYRNGRLLSWVRWGSPPRRSSQIFLPVVFTARAPRPASGVRHTAHKIISYKLHIKEKSIRLKIYRVPRYLPTFLNKIKKARNFNYLGGLFVNPEKLLVFVFVIVWIFLLRILKWIKIQFFSMYSVKGKNCSTII